MARRTGQYPAIGQPLAEQIMHALDVSIHELAKGVAVAPAEIQELFRDNPELDAVDIWWRISEYVDEQIGLLLAARRELAKRLVKERAKRATRVAQLRGRSVRSSPRR